MIRIVFTGGTISMQHDAARGGHVPSLDGAALLALVPELRSAGALDIIDFAQLPAAHQTLRWLTALQQCIAQLAADARTTGIVVTHGTDTLEETVYLLARTIAGDVPIVVTGAMRTAADPEWDGARNLADAVRVAADAGARGRGALALLAGRILPGLGTCKYDAMALDAFRAPHLGDEGAVSDGVIAWHRPPQLRRLLPLDARGLHGTVPLVYAITADDGSLIRSVAASVPGLVVAGIGSGNLPPAFADAAVALAEQGTPVVLASRCVRGEVTPLYGFDGGSAVSVRRGLIPAGPRTAQLARMELLIACSTGATYGH